MTNGNNATPAVIITLSTAILEAINAVKVLRAFNNIAVTIGMMTPSTGNAHASGY